MTVSSYNVHYKSGDSTIDDVQRTADSSSIFGLQEVAGNGTMGNMASAVLDTHQPYVGKAKKGDEFSPIFYDRSRFEAVHTESVELHGNGEHGAADSRVANFVVLKEKETGATVLVSNTHWANDSSDARTHSREVMNAKIQEIRDNVPVDGLVTLGDFNHTAPTLNNQTRIPHDETDRVTTHGDQGNGGADLDHILIGGSTTTPATSTTVWDGGESDHNIVAARVQVGYNPNDARKATLGNVNQGAIIYEHANYEGHKTVIGFGNENIHTGWNDSTSSVRVGEDTMITFKDHSSNDDRFNSPENSDSQTYTDDISYVGDAWNDRFSYAEWGPAPVSPTSA